MYNGIGLPTPRGTGTSGYVMTNRAAVRPNFYRNYQFTEKIPETKKANFGIMEHEKKREIECTLLEKRMEMENARKYSKEEIDEFIDQEREILFSRLQRDIRDKTGFKERSRAKTDRYKYSSDFRVHSHSLDEAKDRKNELFAQAVGINSQRHVVGKAFDFEGRQARLEMERKKREKEREELERISVRYKVAEIEKQTEELKMRKKPTNATSRSSSASSSDDDDDERRKRKRAKKRKRRSISPPRKRQKLSRESEEYPQRLERENEPPRERERREREYPREREMEPSRERGREREMEHPRERGREKEMEHPRERGREKEMEHPRERGREREHPRDRMREDRNLRREEGRRSEHNYDRRRDYNRGEERPMRYREEKPQPRARASKWGKGQELVDIDDLQKGQKEYEMKFAEKFASLRK